MGVVQWFVNAIRSIIVWQIEIITADLNSTIMFVAAFDALILTYAALAIWGKKEIGTITRIAAVGMVVVALVIVALVGETP